MGTTVLARLVRQPFVWLGIVALVIATLFLLESSGSGHPPHAIPVHLTSHNHHGANANHHHCKHGKKHCNHKGHHKHCRNGHGQDAKHNRHCRPASGGQT